MSKTVKAGDLVRLCEREVTDLRAEVKALKAALERIERITQPFEEGSRTTSRYPLTLQIHDIASNALKGNPS